ncbi:hypothetical protein [Citrobacter koseri]|uniref:hypothetical protein n=1 Tax=Citrobacter koseri TaxID=545 RepID=UPI0024B67C39|nr:hypothetical protein [Citrobacter koseri]MDI9802634.1 hypothetical protein [Citrobacter koseri]
MMTKKSVFTMWIVIFAGLVACIIIYWRTSYVHKHFSCEAQLTLVDQASSYDVLMNFTFADGTGIYEASGLYKDRHNQEIKTSNKVSFDYWRKGKNIYLISKETNELPKTDIPILDWKPDFFRKRDRGIALQVTQENADGYLFLYDHTPLFYCTRNGG